jgi:hypothetical protein
MQSITGEESMGIIENAKDIADLIKKAGDIELYRKICALEGEIIDLELLPYPGLPAI